MSASYTPSVSMVWYDSLASSTSDSAILNLWINTVALSLVNSPVVEYMIAIKLIQCQCLHHILHQCLWFGVIHWHLPHIIAIRLIPCQCLHHILHQCLWFGVIHWHLPHIIAIKLIQCQCLHHILHLCLLFGVNHWQLPHQILLVAN